MKRLLQLDPKHGPKSLDETDQLIREVLNDHENFYREIHPYLGINKPVIIDSIARVTGQSRLRVEFLLSIQDPGYEVMNSYSTEEVFLEITEKRVDLFTDSSNAKLYFGSFDLTQMFAKFLNPSQYLLMIPEEELRDLSQNGIHSIKVDLALEKSVIQVAAMIYPGINGFIQSLGDTLENVSEAFGMAVRDLTPVKAKKDMIMLCLGASIFGTNAVAEIKDEMVQSHDDTQGLLDKVEAHLDSKARIFSRAEDQIVLQIDQNFLDLGISNSNGSLEVEHRLRLNDNSELELCAEMVRANQIRVQNLLKS